MTRLQEIKANMAQFEQIAKELSVLQKKVLGYQRYEFRCDYFISDMVKSTFHFYIDKNMKCGACIGTIYRESDFSKVLEKLESLKKEIEKCRE